MDFPSRCSSRLHPLLSLFPLSLAFPSLPLFAFEIKFIFYGRIREATRHPTAKARPGRILRLEFIDVGLLGLSPFDSTGSESAQLVAGGEIWYFAVIAIGLRYFAIAKVGFAGLQL